MTWLHDLTDRAADVLEHCQRLALRLQCFATPAGETYGTQYRVDPLRLVRLGERRQAHDLPRLLRQHMRGQIALVQGCMISTIAPSCLSLRRL